MIIALISFWILIYLLIDKSNKSFLLFVLAVILMSGLSALVMFGLSHAFSFSINWGL